MDRSVIYCLARKLGTLDVCARFSTIHLIETEDASVYAYDLSRVKRAMRVKRQHV